LALQNSALLKCGESGDISKGSFSLVFSRSPNTYNVPDCLKQVAASFQQQWRSLSPTNKEALIISGKHAFGETTSETWHEFVT
jgi:hypothetical protein